MVATSYGAFLSYRGEDAALARSLHRRMEAFQLPAALRTNGRAARLRVFLDTFEINPASSVEGELQRRLSASRFLVVLCTPRIHGSKWIPREIEWFQVHAPQRILTVLVDGTPEEAIPRQLLDRRGKDRDGPLFVDLRRGAKTDRDEFLGLMAVLHGCDYDDLAQRHAVLRRRRIAFATAAALLVTGGAIAYDRSMRTVVAAAADKEVTAEMIQRARDALQFAEAPPPATSSAVPAYDAWLQTVGGLLDRRDALRQQAASGVAAAGSSTALVAALLPLLDALAPHVDEVKQSRRWAAEVDEATRNHPEAGATWARVRESLRTADGSEVNANYRGCRIDLGEAAIRGLVPIGIHPQSKLWEFYDLRSAWNGVVSPQRIHVPHYRPGADRLDITSDLGIVFVLLPGGRFEMGAQAYESKPDYDPAAQPDEVPRQTIELAPFLLAKFEMTRGQWRRLGGIPEESGDESLPVNQVSWIDADARLRRHGLLLPTEAQWEYGCRAGTHTPWSTGAEASSLRGFANVPGLGLPEGLLPVGTLKPNAFGLHDMHGNVAELCRDTLYGYDKVAARAGDGLRDGPADEYRTARGGIYYLQDLRSARSAYRFDTVTATWIDRGIGIRPSRSLAP